MSSRDQRVTSSTEQGPNNKTKVSYARHTCQRTKSESNTFVFYPRYLMNIVLDSPIH